MILKITLHSVAAFLFYAVICTSIYAKTVGGDTCDGRFNMEVISLSKDEPGVVVGVFQYENISNFAARLGVHSGGARGKDTYLVSDTGDQWPKVKNYKGGGGTNGQVFLPGVKTKSTMKFSLRSGGEESKSFSVVNWVQLLAEHGMTGRDTGGWCRFEVRDIGLSK